MKWGVGIALPVNNCDNQIIVEVASSRIIGKRMIKTNHASEVGIATLYVDKYAPTFEWKIVGIYIYYELNLIFHIIPWFTSNPYSWFGWVGWWRYLPTSETGFNQVD